MRTLIKTVAVILAAGVLLTAGGLTALYMYDSPPEGIPAEGEIFRVEEGQNLSEVSRELEEQGLIRSRYMLVGMSRLRKTGGMIRAGYYRVLPGMSTTDVHELLVEGRQTLHKVTIPEGWTVSMIAQRLEREGICPAEEFVAAAKDPATVRKELDLAIPAGAESVQGFLFPDTYLFQRAYPAEKVLSHMVKTFFENLDDIAPAYDELPAGELYDKIVLASIVEREYRAEEEAAKIASVFYNRLEGGMRLQSCATVVYVLSEEMGEERPEKLTYDDLEVRSDFNTYRNGGLPPAPIANPGAVALDAAFHPADTDYLYFLLQDPEAGKHTFSRTLSEHNTAYRLYIKQ